MILKRVWLLTSRRKKERTAGRTGDEGERSDGKRKVERRRLERAGELIPGNRPQAAS